ncbi:protein argonaute-3 [Anoplolepis gracilipes]|uniref:protein argonaute-3 n=1 Tax=Anoplolepis gracilipes TaxID=354296 RepID=UPI003B9E25F0
MGRKGKKKNPQQKQTQEVPTSTSEATSSEQLQKEQQKQVPQDVPQKQQVPPGGGQQQQQQVTPSSSQQRPQGAWGQPRQEQQVSQGPAPQQLGAQVSSSQQQPRAWGGQPSQQQPRAWGGQPSQQQIAQQQQVAPTQQRPQGAWGQPQQKQQVLQGPAPQQQLGAQVPPPSQQQPRAWGQPSQPQMAQQQQVLQGPAPQQQLGAQVPPPSQQQPRAWGQPSQPQMAQQQQVAPTQQRPQGAWGQPQQKQQVLQGPAPQQQLGAQVPPPSQQQPRAWGQPSQPQMAQQQQVAPTQQRPQGAWGQPQQKQQVLQGPAPQQQLGAQVPPPSQQQPRAWGSSQQGACGQRHLQQQSVDIGGAGDSKLITGKGSVKRSEQQQQSTSTQQLSQLRDPLKSTITSQKTKLSSDVIKQYQLSIPQRENFKKAGTKGKPIRVYTNMFEIIFDRNFVTNAVHYDVNITPVASKTLYRKVFEQCRVINFKNRYPAFDGKKNAYSANDLPFIDSLETDIELYDEEREKQRTFKIIFKKVANIDLSWIKNLRPGLDEANRDQTGTQVLDIIMRHAPESRFLSIGRSLFWQIDNQEPLGGGLSLSRGGFSSAIIGWKPYINIDVSHKGFPTSQPVTCLMAELTRARDPTPEEVNKRWNREKIEKYLKGLKVIYQIPNQPRTKRTYRLNGLGPNSVEHQFDCEGTMITVADYFMQRKNYKLRYPYLPCLWAGATNRPEKIYLPAELCTIVAGQSINRKLDEDQTSNMIKYAATSAPTRKQRIEQAFAKINVNNSNTMKEEFHLSVRPEMKQVDARILPPPELQYNGRIAKVNRGIWQIQPFKTACNLEKHTWTVLDLSEMILGESIPSFVQSLKQGGKDVGMHIEDPLVPYRSLRSRNTAEITEYFRSKKDLKLIIVIIPDRTDTTYGKVKQITELSLGILTQCIKYRTMKKNSFSAVKNILLKINSKLNGVNHTLKEQNIPQCLKNNDCMLVGGDVTHPSPDAVGIPSIAAVAASSNSNAFQYNIALRLQTPKEEMILDLEEIIISQLRIYQQKTSRLPNKIIYYRDGVSEGQLAYVMCLEIKAIRRACTSVKASNIQITCLVVQKRHHIRLFPTSEADSDDKNKNVKAGTIVDTEITHPNHIDFYLVSHASIQGTARPTKYRCICNDSKLSEDDIEELTYYLCHMYARCTRAVSYPAPTYYAHLGAYRGRALIQGVNIRLDRLDEEQNKLHMRMSQSPMCFV